MRGIEQTISLFWIALAIWVCIGSLGLDIGTFSDPGPGFLPLGTGALLGIFAMAHLVNVRLQRQEKETLESPWTNIRWKNAVFVVIALSSYAFLLPRLGYLIDTLFLMFFLFMILQRKKWYVILMYSLLVIGFSYFIFAVCLMVQFPKGFLGVG